MAHKTDAVTRWWRGKSLRAKVTGVTVTLLAVGLVAAGVGTLAFLRNTLILNVDDQVIALAPTDVASSLIDIQVIEGQVRFDEKPDAADTPYFVAIYDSAGQLRAVGGGDRKQGPHFPETFPLERTQTNLSSAFTIPSEDGNGVFRASADYYPLKEVSGLLTQIVALPVAPVNAVVAAAAGIYTIVALLIIFGSAFLTRLLVTLTFRSMGQVESTAMAIAGGDFSLRMTDIEPTTTEVGRLKTAINAMLGRVDTALSQRDATVRQMRRFIGDASHELRTPLVTVRGYAELYRMGAIRGDEDVAQAMNRIEAEAKRMGVLVEDLLALARLDERRDVVTTPVDLRPVARDAALDVRATAPGRTVTVIDLTAGEPLEFAQPTPAETDEAPRKRSGPRTGVSLALLRRKPRGSASSTARGADESAPEPAVVKTPTEPIRTVSAPIVLGDENRIRQVVTNLLGNARRFTSSDSPIELRLGVDLVASTGWIEIIDHGEGVPDQIKDKIFQRFWRADTSRARETGGTGLGLSIVASIVEALHGSVAVRDTPGGGATFRVAFPLARDRSAAEHASIETQPLPRLPRSLIDDADD